MSNTETTFATIIIGVKHNKLSVVRSTIGTSGIIDTLLCRFEFRSTDWAGIQKQAVFQSMNDYVQHKDEGKYFIDVNEQGECYVPAEVLTGQGEFLIGIFGMYEDGRRISSNMLAFKCDQGCYCIGTTPCGTTPDDYAKIKELIDQKQDKLTAGKGIEIDENNVISCTCEGGYDDTELAKRIDENAHAIATIQGEYVKSESLAKVATTGSYNDLTDKPEEPDLTDYATKRYVDDQISAIDKPNLDGYATKEWVENKGYLTEHQSLENYTTKNYVSDTLTSYAKIEDIPDVSGFIAEIPDEYVTDSELDAKGYITEQSVADKYATKAEAKNPLNITGATTGQIVKIKTIDADGNPTEWEAVDIPSGSGLSGVESVNGKTGAVTITASELIKSSSEANKVSIAEDGTLEVNALTFDKILQSEDYEIILSGGGA